MIGMTRTKRCISLAASLAVALLAACSSGGGGGGGKGGGGGGGGAGARANILFERHRDGAGNIAPILSGSGVGFDADVVDSPAALLDTERGADPFVLYYEASDLAGVETIGVLTADTSDFELPVVGRTQVLPVGASGTGLDDFGTTDPTVIVEPGIPFGQPGHYRMWYEGRGGLGGETSRIISATSADGLSWTDFIPCTGIDETSVSFASVRVADPTVILDGGLYRMWFEAIDSAALGADGPGSIGYADSLDGIAWTVRDAKGLEGPAAGPAFTKGAAGRFDDVTVNAPSVAVDPSLPPGNGYLLLYETRSNVEPDLVFGLATTDDPMQWVRRRTMVFGPSSDLLPGPPFDSDDLQLPCLVVDPAVPTGVDGHFLLYYTADAESVNGSPTPDHIGVAFGKQAP